jgi:hypothetical protein
MSCPICGRAFGATDNHDHVACADCRNKAFVEKELLERQIVETRRKIKILEFILDDRIR